MQTRATGDAAPPSRLANRSTGTGRESPANPMPSPANGASSNGLRSSERSILRSVCPKLARRCRSNSIIATAERNSTQAVNKVEMTAIGRLSGPNTSRQSGMPMKPTLLWLASSPSMLAIATVPPRQRPNSKFSMRNGAMLLTSQPSLVEQACEALLSEIADGTLAPTPISSRNSSPSVTACPASRPSRRCFCSRPMAWCRTSAGAGWSWRRSTCR